MFLLYVNIDILIQFFLEYGSSHLKTSLFAGVFLGLYLDLTQFIIYLVAPDNSKLNRILEHPWGFYN